MSNNDDMIRNRRNFEAFPDDIQYYEDTHKNGIYTGLDAVKNTEYVKNCASAPLPNIAEPVAKKQYQNIVVYAPRTPDDLQVLIEFLKRREPAIVTLDENNRKNAQRCLDFISGAIYALNGSIQNIKEGSLTYLLSPEGVEVKVPTAR